jgi:two-component system phosphate regulon sensor histidine kinase PhoR
VFKSIRFQISLPVIAIIIVIIAIVYIVILRGFKQFYYGDLINQQVRQILLIHDLLPDSLLLTENNAKLYEYIKNIDQDLTERITVIDSTGKVVSDSRIAYDSLKFVENHFYRPEIRALSEGEKISNIVRYSETVRMDMLYVATRLNKSGDYFIRIARSLTDIEQNMARWKSVLLLLLVSTILTMFVVVFFFSTKLQKVINELGELSKGVGTKPLSAHQYMGFSSETDRLYDFIDDTSERLSLLITDLVSQKQEVRALLKSVSEAIIAVDPKLNVLFANDNACRLFDSHFTTDNLPQIPLTGFAHIAVFTEIAERCLAEKSQIEQMVQYRNRQRDYDLRVMCAPVSSGVMPEKKIALLTVVDLTEEKRLARAKAEFVEAASHELRTPLTILKGYVETLDMDTDPEMQKKSLNRINHSVDRLEGLIHDLLQLSYLESGKATIKYVEIEPEKIISEILTDVQPLLLGKEITVEVECAGKINSVSELVYIALYNLVTNAIKYNVDNGRILIRCMAENGHYVLSVSDSGLGIPEEYREKVFERFFRMDKHRSRETGGTGLGLAIVKHIVNVLKGTIRIVNGIDNGSCFVITIPK